ncbi:MAG TPA: PVC-type heme-binding CxxCH protein [Candidatus Limnocylindria bacterium]|nr:PVC-type heme-binding CxxCH protein [Candidatus Limnocylindria bacterium]
MSRYFAALVLLCASWRLAAAEPLRVFIRAGVKTHGPNQHDHPHFLQDYTKLLNERGLKADGSLEFPTAAQLDQTDVVVIYAQDGMKIVGAERERFEAFLKRGGGVVVIHDGVVSGDEHEWCKKTIGGAWRWDGNEKTKTKWFEGNVGVYFTDTDHPITKGISNFDWKDEVYNQLDMSPDVHVLATSFLDVFTIWPQIWTYERTMDGAATPYRAFVSIPGHEYTSFEAPQYKAILLRGISWAAKHENLDEYCRPTELASLRYPEGGPTPGVKAASQFIVHPEFNVSLVADENVAEKIMSLEWDPKGRLWVVETPEYPGGRDINKADNRVKSWREQDPKTYPIGGKEPRVPQDRISMLEDTNGDGIMDKKTVFASGLELPTSLVFYKDGVIVTKAPDILWIRDTDGDGKADKTEVLYTGWGTFDTHAVINNLRWGPDGWVYGTVGYTRGKVKSGDGTKNFGDIAAGVYRFRPDGSMLEQVAAWSCNTWGCEIAPDGEVVFTTATCGMPICHVVIPEKILARGNVGGHLAFENVIEENKIYPALKETRQPYVQIDWVGAWTAAAGACIYDGGAWPAKWAPDNRYAFFMSEATMHLFHQEFLEPTGATFKGHKEEGRKEMEFVNSTDYWFRPIHSRVGPDGAMYLVDFYNQIAVHNDTRGPAHGARNAATRPDRDHHFTRVYRIQHKEAKALPPYKLDAQDPDGLVAMLNHPNGWVRTTANRLLNETQAKSATPALANLLKTGSTKYGRMQALYALNNLGGLDEQLLTVALKDSDAAVRKNAVKIVGENATGSAAIQKTIEALLNDSDPRTRIQSLMALGSLPPTKEAADAVVAVWPSLKDQWFRSAAVGAAAADPILYLEACFRAKDPAFAADYVAFLAKAVGQKDNAELAVRALELISKQPASVDGLKVAALEALSANSKPSLSPEWSATLEASLQSLLSSDRCAGATLPFVARWDKQAKLASAAKPAIAKVEAQLTDASLSDDVRGRVAVSLVSVRQFDTSIIPAVTALIGSTASPALQQRVVDALGAVPEGGLALVGVFNKVPSSAVESAFGNVIKRPESTSALLEAIARKDIPLTVLGPARSHRLRTHPDQAVAKRAEEVLESLTGPEQKEKDALIAKYRPEVEKPGSADEGHKVFTANCAGCHIFKGEGRNLAPNLTGMGAHGAADLLVHILDPNRQVEPNFISISIETKDGTSYDGIIDRENASELVLRDAASDHNIRISEIKTRASTGRSLMPEGFESLGADSLRNLLAYICADENRFRILDLGKAFTANSSRGLFSSPENTDDTVKFRRYGLFRAEDVPFDVVSPDKVVANAVVLKGGAPNSWSRKSMPQRVEVKVGFAAKRLYFLGGVAGWGFPAVGEKVPVVKAVLHFADGGTQDIIMKNGEEIADYNGTPDVPGSKNLPWTQGRGQIRWFGKNITHAGVLQSIELSSYDNGVAPVLFGITAEVGEGGPSNKEAAAAPPSFKWGSGLKTLLVGGGSSHDFKKFFGDADTATLNGTGMITANYTEPVEGLGPVIGGLDVLLMSNNQAFADDDSRKAVFAHVKAGKGLILVHPALWYNWNDWPEYNRVLCGGGSRGHDRYGEFEVKVTEPNHPLMKGVPASFTLKDELYYFEPDPKGTPVKVLATAFSKSRNKEFPMVFVVENPEARVVGITLGHDASAHDLPAYQTLLANAVKWSAHKE